MIIITIITHWITAQFKAGYSVSYLSSCQINMVKVYIYNAFFISCWRRYKDILSFHKGPHCFNLLVFQLFHILVFFPLSIITASILDSISYIYVHQKKNYYLICKRALAALLQVYSVHTREIKYRVKPDPSPLAVERVNGLASETIWGGGGGGYILKFCSRMDF